MTTKIEWATDSWNPIQAKIKGKQGRGYHCTKISPGCDNCYAESTNALRGNGLPFDNRATEFELVEKTLEAPLHWKKPRRVFVQSMGDLFHEGVPFPFIDKVFKVMAKARRHIFMLLTKRPEIMVGYLKWLCGSIGPDILELIPPDNVWWGVTTENQDQAEKRIPVLLQIPAVVRFVSVEPMLGAVKLTYMDVDRLSGNYQLDALRGNVTDMGRLCPSVNKLDWVICGGESRRNARPMHPDWVRSLRDQCQSADVPFFFKQWGEWAPAVHGPTRKKVIVGGNGHARSHASESLYDDDCIMGKYGKKKAGHLLDGREWNEYPEVNNYEW